MFNARRRPDARRLTQPAEFQAVLSRGARLSGKRFVLRAGPNAGAAARLGLIASRKAAKRAVDRNRAKRLAREVFRNARGELPAWDLVLQLRENLRNASNHVVRAELAGLLREIKRRAASDNTASLAGTSAKSS